MDAALEMMMEISSPKSMENDLELLELVVFISS